MCSVKERQAYLTDIGPAANYLASLGIPIDRVIVVMRPPGTWGLYHNFENPLFEQVLNHVAGNPEAYIVFLPWIPSQGEAVCARSYTYVWVPPVALDGPNLLYHADLVINGGGTMNREAAVLGTSTYSIFKGRLAAVDRYLADRGCMRHIGEDTDVSIIEIRKKQPRAPLANGQLVHEITDAILGVKLGKRGF